MTKSDFLCANDSASLLVKEKDGVATLAFSLFESLPVKHAFSTRLGGVSTGHLASMNLSYARQDDPDNVTENFKRIGKAVGFTIDQLVFSDQQHHTNVRRVTKEDAGAGIVKPLSYQDVDGLITNEKGICLATFFADCVPLYFVDPVHQAIGLSHSGWRGTAGRMGAVTIAAMQKEFGSRPEEIYAAIGPSICKDCYEVSEEVYEEFSKRFSKEELGQCFQEKGGGKYQLDLWRANEGILFSAGILKEHLTVTDVCTCCNPKLLFSHRASKGMRGNLAAFLMLS